MKKAYIIPHSAAINLSFEGMIAGSEVRINQGASGSNQYSGKKEQGIWDSENSEIWN